MVCCVVVILDSDIPTRGKAVIGSDSDDDSAPESKPRQRLPSDSGSDPEAVRATAEDIFGEADDISDDDKGQEEVSLLLPSKSSCVLFAVDFYKYRHLYNADDRMKWTHRNILVNQLLFFRNLKKRRR